MFGKVPGCATILTVTSQSLCGDKLLHRTALPSDTSCKFNDPQATCPADQLATNLGVPTTPSDLVICRNDSQNSRKHYTCDFNLLYRIKIKTCPKKKTYGDRSERVPNRNLSCLQDTSPPQHDIWVPIRQTQQASVSSFNWGFIT